MTAERVPYTQAGRMMAVSTKLGEDVLLLHHLEIDERVNTLFEMQAAVKSQRDDLQAGDLVGSTVDFRLRLKDGGERWWNGFVTRMHEAGLTTRGTRSYAMTVRPKLWLLSQRSDCRIFQNQTTMQVIETFMSEHGITDYILRVTGKIDPQPYSVQWNETDLDYMLRRMQQDGLFYFFTFAQGKHTLIVSDHPWGYDKASQDEVRFAQGSAAQDHITDWRRTFEFTPGRRAGRDWNFETMQAPQGQQTSFAQVPGNADHELYEFPGRFLDTMAADQAMKSRIQATETGYETVEAASTVRILGAGQTFTPVDVAKPGDTFDSQVVTAIRHVATDPTYETGSGQPTYDNTFTVMPAKTPATPHRVQRRPRVDGTQIALIAGPSGEEIYTDQYGRVKVWFPWDRRAKKDGSDTCWIRVGQPWAGTTWGHQVIPRVGMEALISYQEGDPDRPFVTALVPDPTNPTPYPLPDNKTRMVFRSNSYKSQGFNEMTFEDATGGENMFFHAQKDHTTKIENNQTNSVGANHSNVIGQNQALTVGANQTQEIGGSANLTVGGTGAGASALMAPLAGMAGQTASLLGQAFQAGGDSSGGGASGGASALTSALGGLMSMAGAAASGGGGAGGISSLLGMAMGAAGAAGGGIGGITGTMMPQLASSLIGILGGSGQQAQSQVGNGPSPRPDAGTALAAAGSSLAQAAQGLFSMGGILNTTVGTMRTDSTGVASIEQVGSSKVTNVGSAFATQVGKAWSLQVGETHKTQVGQDLILDVGDRMQTAVGNSKTIDVGQNFEITAGERFMVKVGDCCLQMDKTGIFLIQGKETVVVGSGTQLTLMGGPVEYFPSLVQGKTTAAPAECMRRMADAGSPFVKA